MLTNTRYKLKVAGVAMAVAITSLIAAPAEAATLTSVSVTPANPTADLATATTYDINFSGTTATTANCIVVRFDSTIGGASAGLPSGMTIAGSTLAGSTAITPANWNAGTATTNKVTFTATTGQAVTSGNKLTITGITHNPTAAGTYYAFVDTYSNVGCTTPIDSATAAYAITSNVNVSGSVGPTLTFSVAALNSGTCNGATINATNSTTTAVPFGTVTTSANAIGGQTLTVTTNSTGGYALLLRGTGQMNNGTRDLNSVTGGTNATPANFTAAGVEGFGYTTDHALSGTAARFQTNKWAALNTVNEQIAYIASGAVTNDATKLCYQMGVASSTPSGTYTTQMIYTAVPVF